VSALVRRAISLEPSKASTLQPCRRNAMSAHYGRL
jgi:hypothetical protein